MTLGPNLSLLVRAAMAASVVITSGTGAGDDRRSESQIESSSLPSRKSQSDHRNAAPSRPAGHGPGITPIRYLMSMAGDRTRRSEWRQGDVRLAVSGP